VARLNPVIIVFDEMKVSEFKREGGFYKFPVKMYALSKQTGYLYKIEKHLIVGYNTFTNGLTNNNYLLKRKVNSPWFEYKSE
jgi:hypothetical protein